MGQRLVVKITDNGRELANAYYHWSAYTGSSLNIANDIINDFIANEDTVTLTKQQQAVRLLFHTGARFYPKEIEWMEEENIDKDQFDFAFDDVEADRNSGLLSVSQKGMKESDDWAEGNVEIDITTGEILFDVYYADSMEDFDYEDIEDINRVPQINLEHELSMANWNEFYNSIRDVLDAGWYYAIHPNKHCYYQFIG